MLTGTAPDCRPHYIDSSPTFTWSDCTLEGPGVRCVKVAMPPDFYINLVKSTLYIKTSFSYILYEVIRFTRYSFSNRYLTKLSLYRKFSSI